MKIFVTGATGFQGGNIANALLKEGYQVSTLKRNPDTGTSAMSGIDIIKGGLDNPESLLEAMKGAQAAVYSFPLIFNMEQAKTYTSNFIASAKKEDVDLIIYNTTFHLAQVNTGYLALDMKVEMKKLFDASGLNVITLAPDIYLDNISAPWSIPVILEQKIVPYPLDGNQKIPWISHKDLGQYVVKAISKPELSGQTLPIGGNLVTGNEIAAAISKETNLELNFVSVPVNEFEEQLKPGFGALAAKEISNLYRYIAKNQKSFSGKDYSKANELLGITPQSLDQWAQSVSWSLS